jgi:hypothetical protein
MTKVFVPRDAAALSVGADDVAAAIEAEAKKLGIGPARPRRRGLPDRHQVEDGAEAPGRPQIHRLQRRRGRQRHLRRPHADGGRSLHPDRGHGDRRPRVGATKGYIYIRSEYPHAIASCAAIEIARAAARRGHPGLGLSTSEVRVGAGAYVCGEETSLLEASKASAAWCAPSRRCRRIKACSASRPWSTT